MTNHWNDIANSDVVMVCGANAAENHPMSFKWVQAALGTVNPFSGKAKPAGKLVVIDPRYTKTAAKASVVDGVQLYCKIRPGTDIAFFNGMIKWAIDNNRINWQYVRDCSNASFLIDSSFETCTVANAHPDGGTQTGIFSGLLNDTRRHRKYKYNTTHKGVDSSTYAYWRYQYGAEVGGNKVPLVDWDPTLSTSKYWNTIPPSPSVTPNGDSVWAKLIDHVSRYDVTEVSKITGADADTIEKIYDVYTSTYESTKSANIMYAMGTTQHTYGSQNVRAYSILQTLLGNMGVAGGGINAMRGESNVQGSTDHALLSHLLPGYLVIPTNASADNATNPVLPSPFKSRAAYKAYWATKYQKQDPFPTTVPASVAWWTFGNRYLDSLLQAWWPVENMPLYTPGPQPPNNKIAMQDIAYSYLPKVDKDTTYTYMDIFEDMANHHDNPQKIFGLMCWGQNPAVGGPSSSFERAALKNLDWLVCVDLWKTETAAFWEPTIPGDGTSDCIGIPGVATEDIDTEVFMLPAAASYEKEGSISNSSRMSQWRYKAANPPGLAMDDLSILNELGKRLITAYQGDTPGLLADPVANLYWGPYCNGGTNRDAFDMDGSKYDDGVIDTRTGLLEANAHKVSKEMNGYYCTNNTATTVANTNNVIVGVGRRVTGFWSAEGGHLQENGGTSSGNWLYCCMYPDPNIYSGQEFRSSPLDTFVGGGGNRQAKRDPVEITRADGNYIGLYGNWSCTWPLNRRIIYNGAAYIQATGAPLAPNKWVLQAKGVDPNIVGWMAGGDVTDGMSSDHNVRYPFIMNSEGVALLFGPTMEEGPFPEHYEPWETVLNSNIISNTLVNPALFAHQRAWDHERAAPGDSNYPIIGTTYRVTEHWQAGAMTRNQPWLCELMPEAFVELSEELAGILDIVNGDTVEIKTKRTALYGQTMKAKACVTKRFKPYDINGSIKHVIGAIWHFGYTGFATGDSANLLTASVGDANTAIPESKAFICDIRRNNGGDDFGYYLSEI